VCASQSGPRAAGARRKTDAQDCVDPTMAWHGVLRGRVVPPYRWRIPRSHRYPRTGAGTVARINRLHQAEREAEHADSRWPPVATGVPRGLRMRPARGPHPGSTGPAMPDLTCGALRQEASRLRQTLAGRFQGITPPCYGAGCTRHTVLPASSATRRTPSAVMASPTGRPCASPVCGLAMKPVRKSSGRPAGVPSRKGTKTTR
jgi:hypothetical protein